MNRRLGLLAFVTLVGALGACSNEVPSPVAVSQSPVAASASPSVASDVFFLDDFDGAATDDSQWKVFERNGVVVQRNGHLEILSAGNQPSFPYFLSRNGIIPATGPFYFEVAYEYLAQSNQPVSFCLDYLPAEFPNEEPLTKPFMRSAGFYGDMRTEFELETGPLKLDAKGGIRSKKRFVMRLECDGNNQYRLIHGGVELGTFESKRRPMRFWVSNYPVKDGASAFWPHLRLDYVKAGVLGSPDPAAPAPIPSPSPSPSDAALV